MNLHYSMQKSILVPVKEDEREIPERPPNEVIRELVRILGAPLVAVLGDARSTHLVRAWTEGESVPKRMECMHFALRVTEVLLQREAPDVVRAWFGGTNPDLNDENPLL